MVSQCAVLADFGLFLVLADKVLPWPPYRCEGVLTPSVTGSLCLPSCGFGSHAARQHPRFTNPAKDQRQGRSFLQSWCASWKDPYHLHEEKRSQLMCFILFCVIDFRYPPIQNNDSVFHAVEPVMDKINELPKATGGLINLKRKTNWFRRYKEFTFSDAHDIIFLRARIAVLCAKGFMIVDLAE
jgi:hypothetical protein